MARLHRPEIQARLAQPPDQVVTHPETGTSRALFACPDVLLTPVGPRIRVIVATHKATPTPARIGTTRDGVVLRHSSLLVCHQLRSRPPMLLISTRHVRRFRDSALG